ncbi:E3 ubiquitin-protein ligase ATL59-like [Tasmannia lanceolata]|uniref:E3 ubiquitin-protein ligase ATL59-like n=1 Tax=Tasmannia lanceolata TaxID=3420 RepID=UPI004063F8F0
MGLSAEYSGLVIKHLYYKAALVVSLVRWVALRCVGRWGPSSSSSSMDGQVPRHNDVGPTSSSSSSSTYYVSAQRIRDSLHVMSYGETGLGERGSTCAVCLNELRWRDKVWDLRNCCHVFHKRCLDRWLDHHDHNTCPLCRAPLLGPPVVGFHPRPEPSWPVERLLYLFGDDLPFFAPS